MPLPRFATAISQDAVTMVTSPSARRVRQGAAAAWPWALTGMLDSRQTVVPNRHRLLRLGVRDERRWHRPPASEPSGREYRQTRRSCSVEANENKPARRTLPGPRTPPPSMPPTASDPTSPSWQSKEAAGTLPDSHLRLKRGSRYADRRLICGPKWQRPTCTSRPGEEAMRLAAYVGAGGT